MFSLLLAAALAPPVPLPKNYRCTLENFCLTEAADFVLEDVTAEVERQMAKRCGGGDGMPFVVRDGKGTIRYAMFYCIKEE